MSVKRFDKAHPLIFWGIVISVVWLLLVSPVVWLFISLAAFFLVPIALMVIASILINRKNKNHDL